MPGPGSGPGRRMYHDHALHPAMAFDGTPKVIDARREGQHEFKPLAGSQGNTLFECVGLPAGIRHEVDPGSGKQATVKTVEFPALIPHHQVHELPCLYVHPGRRESKIIDDDLHLLIPGGAGSEAQQKDRQ